MFNIKQVLVVTTDLHSVNVTHKCIPIFVAKNTSTDSLIHLYYILTIGLLKNRI